MIRGRVQDEAGNAIGGARVYATQSGALSSPLVLSDSQGGFAFENLEPGVYDVWVSDGIHRPQLMAGIRTLRQMPVAIPVLAAHGFLAQGKVTTTQNVPLSGVRVELLAGDGLLLASTLTDVMGAYSWSRWPRATTRCDLRSWDWRRGIWRSR